MSYLLLHDESTKSVPSMTVYVFPNKKDAYSFKNHLETVGSSSRNIKVVEVNAEQGVRVYPGLTKSNPKTANPRRKKRSKKGFDEEDEALAELEAEFPTRLSSHVVANRKAKANQVAEVAELVAQYGPQAVQMAEKYGPSVVAGVKKALEARKKK